MAASDFLACIPYSMPLFDRHSVRHAKQLVLVLAARSRRETFHIINDHAFDKHGDSPIIDDFCTEHF